MRRLLRIFPCFYVYLLTLFVLTYLNVISVDYSAIFFAMFYVQNLNVFQNTELFASSWLVKHSWSLSVEEQFYLVYPFVFAGLKKLIVGHPVKLVVLASLVCTFFRGLNYSFPEISRMIGGVFFMHADFLLYGGVLCIVLQQYAQPIKTRLFPVRYGLLALAAVVALYSARVEYYSGINILIFGNLILFSNAYILLFFLLYPESVLGKWFEARPIKWIGLLSYSLYVWQQLFMGSKNLWSEYGFLATFPFSLLAVFAASIASYYLVERPFLRMKKLYSAI
jgi:peptidoglycan/LPS O-acetylase OafA/YrhL